MGKFGWDLPPGVTHRMIEEQAGGDPAAEAFAELMYDQFPVNTPDEIREPIIEWAWEQVGKAYGEGYQQGMSDEKMAQEMEKLNKEVEF